MKNVRVYPYFVDFKLEKDTPDFWRENFKKENVKANIVPYGENFLVIVVSHVSGNKAFGRVLKLRTDVPTKINTLTGDEGVLSLLKNENIVEASHFIYYVADKIILAEYNFHGTRHLISPLRLYFEKKFERKDVEVLLIQDTETLEHMKREAVLKRLSVCVAREKLEHIEKTTGISLLESLFSKLTTEKYSTFEIAVKRSSRKRGDSLDKQITMEITKKLLEIGRDELEELKIEGITAVYDLLNNNTIFFNVPLRNDQGLISSSDFFRKVDDVYSEYRDTLLEIYKTLD